VALWTTLGGPAPLRNPAVGQRQLYHFAAGIYVAGRPRVSDSPSGSAPGTVDPSIQRAVELEAAQRLSLSFATLMVGQTHRSESDYPYDPFWAEMPVGTRLTPETFRDVLGFETPREIVMRSMPRPEGPSGTSYEDLLAAELYDTLVAQMRATLGRLTQVLARGEGIVQVPYFLFGRLNGGNLVGLRSISVET
jgi:hypothetical protein